MPKILRQRPVYWFLWFGLYLAVAYPVAWLAGPTPGTPPATPAPVTVPAPAPTVTPPPAPAASAKLPEVPMTGTGPEISVPPMKPGNVMRPPRNRIDQNEADV